MSAPGPDASPDASPARQRRDFGYYISGHLVASCGTWMQRAALGWLVWELTRSPAWVGAVALADLVSVFWVAPFAGAVADRNNPFKLQLATVGSLMALSALLWAVTASGNATIWFILAWAVADSTLHGFNQPARMVMVNALVVRERMSQAIASNSIAANVARSLGPAMAGVVIVHGSIAAVFFISMFAYIAMILAILALRHRLDRPGLAPKSEPIGRDIVLGFSYVVKTPHIAILLLLALGFALLARPFTELFPALAGEVLRGGPETLAMLMSAQGIGALFGAVWMLKRRRGQVLVAITYGAAMGIGFALLGFSLAPTPWLAIVCIGVAGLFHVVANIGMQSTGQIYSAPQMRGRVVALYGLVFRTGPAVGAFAMGVGAAWIPLQWLIAAGGVLFALILVLSLPMARRAYAPVLAPA